MPISKRRLTDLWLVGRELTLDDGGGDPIVVWLQKLNPIEAAEATRYCDAARSRVLAFRSDHDSDGFNAVKAAVLDYGDDSEKIIDFLLLEDRGRSQRLHEARNAADDEWAKDNYLQGLHDAWEDGLKYTWAVNHDDVEAKRVFDELARFTKSVDEAVEDDQHVMRDAMGATPIEQLRDRMTERLLEMEANQAWLEELHRCHIWMGTREGDDHKVRYFFSRAEVNELARETYIRLRTAYENLEVDASMGKSSGVTPPSSASPEPSSAEVTPSSSGLVGVAP